MTRDEFEPVQPTNLPPRRRARRDPDAIPAPTEPTEPTPPPQATQPNGVAVRPNHQTGGTTDLVTALMNAKAPSRPPVGEAPRDTDDTDDTAIPIVDLIRMRTKTVDPFRDYVNDATRKLRWIQAAIKFIADMTGRTLQDVERDALLGVAPLPRSVLDQFYRAQYGDPLPDTYPL